MDESAQTQPAPSEYDEPSELDAVAVEAAESAPVEAGTDASAPPAASAQTRMHALAEHFAAMLSSTAAQLLKTPFHVRTSSFVTQPLGDFLAGVRDPTCCYALTTDIGQGDDGDAPPSDPPASWLEISPELAFACVGRLLGGAADQLYAPERVLTAIERRLVRRMLQPAVGGLFGGPDSPGPAGGRLRIADSWRCPSPDPQVTRRPVVTARFDLALSAQIGKMRLALPVDLLADVSAPAGRIVSSRAGPLQLSVALPDLHVPADDLNDLAVGDILTTETPAGGEVILRLAGIPKFAARLGTCAGNRAVTITRLIHSTGQLPQP